MRYLTDHKRALGQGSARDGTHHFWSMTKSSAALLVLVPLFVFTFGPMLGREHAEVVAYFSRPFPAIVAALTIVVGFMHFLGGVQVLLEDYTHGLTRTVLLIAMTLLSYGAAATGVFAIARLAL
ncbi:succinate dehydrogenase, hydrophobic membrane anchor protein [Brevirhabdus pacifica]|uniref:Succinate dehydrogenase hydrophobic membrane anchor subunit n=1 Tax=Brevirhabdus pacifica TaxID=1267768 RepID=A0A1U7DJP9_9RHOB|nr:succinate dehydrogenase, hydrophobic membrane anchor protein [Brevirhabdus pacifica]APX90216.1 succinate dehydrogenase, hydrophobic membrane anchor protein [Brevirhabdus pacifica]OWU78731.1 succinate dehydrogenase [Loktanella sp. 22II-4b]PJJ80649.1 succinate dehydrogenase subunit D [Brevirhabdus pacifica]